MGIIADWLSKPQESGNRRVMDNLVKGFDKMKKEQLIKDQEGEDKEMEEEMVMESEELLNDINEDLQEMEQNGQFEELPEVDGPEETQSTVSRGIFIFHDQDGSMSHEIFGSVSLENMTYYNRYLSEIESGLWKNKLAGEKDA